MKTKKLYCAHVKTRTDTIFIQDETVGMLALVIKHCDLCGSTWPAKAKEPRVALGWLSNGGVK